LRGGDDGFVPEMRDMTTLDGVCHHVVQRMRVGFSPGKSSKYNRSVMDSSAQQFDADVRAGGEKCKEAMDISAQQLDADVGAAGVRAGGEKRKEDAVAGLVCTGSLNFQNLGDPITSVGDGLSASFLLQLSTTPATFLTYVRCNFGRFDVSHACMLAVLAVAREDREPAMRQFVGEGALTANQLRLLNLLRCYDRATEKVSAELAKSDPDYKSRHQLALRHLMCQEPGQLRRLVALSPKASPGVYYATVSAQVMHVLRDRVVVAIGGATSARAKACVDMASEMTVFSLVDTSPQGKLSRALKRYHVTPQTGLRLCRWARTNGDVFSIPLLHASVAPVVFDLNRGHKSDDGTMLVEEAAEAVTPMAGNGYVPLLSTVPRSFGALGSGRTIVPIVEWKPGTKAAGVCTIGAAVDALLCGDAVNSVVGGDPGVKGSVVRCSVVWYDVVWSLSLSAS